MAKKNEQKENCKKKLLNILLNLKEYLSAFTKFGNQSDCSCNFIFSIKNLTNNFEFLQIQ